MSGSQTVVLSTTGGTRPSCSGTVITFRITDSLQFEIKLKIVLVLFQYQPDTSSRSFPWCVHTSVISYELKCDVNCLQLSRAGLRLRNTAIEHLGCSELR